MPARPPSAPRRRLLASLVAGALLGPAAVALATLPRPAPRAGAAASVATPLAVSVGGPTGPPVPARFLGLSFEAQSIPDLARFASTGDLPLLLRSLGPSVLRLGGVTADSRVAFAAAPGPMPSWAHTAISPADLEGLASLAHAADARVLLTVGLAHPDPQAAAGEVAAARQALGPALAGAEIGNEPDAFARHGLRAARWGVAAYAAEVEAYRTAIGGVAPGVPLAGPDTTGASFARWGPAEAQLVRPALLTVHRYPLVCSAVPAPSIAGLLSPATRARDLAQLRSDAAIARGAGIPWRIDETNSVSCGGRAGVSDTFASALWATQLVTTAMGLGATGVNFHDLPASCAGYSPLCAATAADLDAGRLRAAPEWYALLLTRSLIGERPLATAIAPPSPHVTAEAFAGAGVTHLVLVDTAPGGGAQPVLVHAPGATRATILRLTAPSLAATTGVRIGGRAVSATGALAGPLARGVGRTVRGVVAVSLAPASAALVTLTGGR